MKTVIKWSGSKASQAEQIAQFIPNGDTYYEPFCGGASMLAYLIDKDKFKRYICSDLNEDLIGAYLAIKHDYKVVASEYSALWGILNKDDNLERKKKYFNEIRTEFNRTHNPYLFYFIMRTTTNGMPRYNKQGEFNNSFHVTRNGMKPQQVEKLLAEWAEKTENVEFRRCPYWEIQPNANDFVYLDPPYENTKGMYYGTIDYDKLWEYLNDLPCRYALSFDGIADKDYTRELPINAKRYLLESGNSSFRRTIGKSNNTIVYESLWVRNDI